MKHCRIKPGALISQDFAILRWPEVRGGFVEDTNMIFEVEWTGSFWDCKADGYGYHKPQGKYGNGSIFVHDEDGVEMVDKLVTFSPGAVVDGVTVTPESWMWVLVFALQGIPWAVEAVSDPSFNLYGKMKDYKWREAEHYLKIDLNHYEKRLAEAKAALDKHSTNRG